MTRAAMTPDRLRARVLLELPPELLAQARAAADNEPGATPGRNLNRWIRRAILAQLRRPQ